MAADTVTVIRLFRNQIQQSEREDPLGFTHDSAAVRLRLQGCSEGFRRVQDFYRKQGGAQEKKGLFLSRAIVFGRGRIFIMQIASSSYVGRWRLPPCIDQKIPDWLIEINCLGEAETLINEV